MKKRLLKGILTLGILGAALTLSNQDTLAGIPSEHSLNKINYIETAGIPSEHSIVIIKPFGIPSEH